MKAPNWSRCTEEQLWKYVATHLDHNGIETVLVGDGAACVHTNGMCKTPRLDLMLTAGLTPKLSAVMAELGFKPQGETLFRHPHCKHLAIEFNTRPLAVGDDVKIKPLEVAIGKQNILILAPIDCIRIDLLQYIHEGSHAHLERAAHVGARHAFNETKIQRFCVAEGAPRVFAEFESLVEASVPYEDE